MKAMTNQGERSYSGYALLESMDLSVEDLRNLVKIMEDIIVNSSETERNKKFFFEMGLRKANDNYLHAKERYEEMDTKEKIEFRVQEEQYKEKVKRIKPVVDFIRALKETIE